MKKILGLLAMVLVTAATSTLGACGDSEGDTCVTDNDCGSQLLCQPINGRGDRCCPTPPEDSDNDACHAVTGATDSTGAATGS
jgi:hypothetical protein